MTSVETETLPILFGILGGRRHSREIPTLHLQKGAAGHRKNAQKPARAFFGPAGLPPVAQR